MTEEEISDLSEIEIATLSKEKMFDFSEEKLKRENAEYHSLYTLRQAFDDCILELQLVVSHLFGEALDDPNVKNEIRKINSTISKLIYSKDITIGVHTRSIKRERK